MIVEGLGMPHFKTQTKQVSRGGSCGSAALQTYHIQTLTFECDQGNSNNTRPIAADVCKAIRCPEMEQHCDDPYHILWGYFLNLNELATVMGAILFGW